MISKNLFKNWSKTELKWFGFSNLLLFISIIFSIQFAEGNMFLFSIIALGTITGTWGVIAATKRKVSNFIINFASIFLLSIVYFNLQLYAMAVTYVLFLIPMQLHGFYSWISFKNTQNDEIMVIRTLNSRHRICIFCMFLIGIIAFYFGIYFVIETFNIRDTYTLVPFLQYLDVTSASSNVTGQFLLNLRYLLNQSIYWKIVNLVQILTFGYIIFVLNELIYFPVFVMYIIWFINSMWFSQKS